MILENGPIYTLDPRLPRVRALSVAGPLVVGGTGQTAGPNSKNQAISPIPGLREEELSERPSETIITTPDVRPVTRNPPRNPATTR